MEYQFFIHGKPSELESTGNNRFDGLDKIIRDEFFGRSPSEEPSLVCEIREHNSLFYSVYTYYHQGRDNAGRQNGYCALTLIVQNEYCLITEHIYDLLKWLYDNYLLRKLNCISADGKWLIGTFRSMTNLGELWKPVEENLRKQYFSTIDSRVIPENRQGDCMKYNPADADTPVFYQDWKRSGKIYVSQAFMTAKERVEALSKEVQNSRAVYNSYEELERKHHALSTEYNDLKGKYEVLKGELARVRNRPAPISTPLPPENKGRYDQVVLQYLKDISSKVSNLTIKSEPQIGQREKESLAGRSLLSLIIRFLKRLNPIHLFTFLNFLFLIFLCTWAMGVDTKISKVHSYPGATVSTASEKTIDAAEGDTLQTQLKSLEDQVKNSEVFVRQLIHLSDDRIDIKGLKKLEMEVGKIYELQLGSGTKLPENCVWKINGERCNDGKIKSDKPGNYEVVLECNDVKILKRTVRAVSAPSKLVKSDSTAMAGKKGNSK